MTKKHFEAIAANIAQQVGEYERMIEAAQRDFIPERVSENVIYWQEKRDVVRRVVNEMCWTFQGFNPNFDATRFTRACGL